MSDAIETLDELMLHTFDRVRWWQDEASGSWCGIVVWSERSQICRWVRRKDGYRDSMPYLDYATEGDAESAFPEVRDAFKAKIVTMRLKGEL